MNYTDTGTLPRFCSKCGASLQGVYFDYGNGQRLCGLCQPYRVTPSVLPYQTPQPDYTGDWLKENLRLTEELSQAKQRIAELEGLTAWDDERRNTLVSLLESYAHTHRQFYFPGITEFDTEDTDVRDDIKALWNIRRQIGELIGIPPLPKDEVQS